MTNQQDTRPQRTMLHESAECASCGTSVRLACDECYEPICSVCFLNIHLQSTGCFGVYDNDAQPSWYGLASGLARQAQ